MIYIFAVLTLAVVVSTAPQKRQLPTCTNAFQLTTNPCSGGGGPSYYPVPNDNTKFVQCDILGGAYVVQCPQGSLYNQALNTCQQPQTIVPATSAPAPANPCTAQAINSGSIYFAFPGDSTKFYQCTGIGQLNVAQCPQSLVWSQARVSCIIPAGTGGIGTGIGTGIGLAPATQTPVQPNVNNPCSPQQIAANNLYFAHPDPSKFIQCDLLGNAYEMLCPTNLYWNQYYEVCTASFQFQGVGRR